MRIAKYISSSGYCSRRDAEKLIYEEKVYINNTLCKKPNVTVTNKDIIKIGNKVIKIEKEIKLWKFYKPIKIICTNKDPDNRKTVFDILPKNMPRVISVGRLDFMSEGLLLLTNNGDLARNLELPKFNYTRVYNVCVAGKITSVMLSNINKGLTINNFLYSKIEVKFNKLQKPYNWLIFKLKEGKNREIRNICKFFNWKVIKLIRTQYGPIKLQNLKQGEVKQVMNLKKLV